MKKLKKQPDERLTPEQVSEMTSILQERFSVKGKDIDFEQARELVESRDRAELWENDDCAVLVYRGSDNDKHTLDDTYKGGLDLMVLKHKFKESWSLKELKGIKTQLFGEEREAFQLIPSISKRMDEIEDTILWVLPENMVLPFGLNISHINTHSPSEVTLH